MSCCGQRRSALASPRAVAPGPSGAAVSAGAGLPAVPRAGDVTLRYVGARTFATRSAHTGRFYACVGANAALSVDPRDVELLLRTRVFARP